MRTNTKFKNSFALPFECNFSGWVSVGFQETGSCLLFLSSALFIDTCAGTLTVDYRHYSDAQEDSSLLSKMAVAGVKSFQGSQRRSTWHPRVTQIYISVRYRVHL